MPWTKQASKNQNSSSKTEKDQYEWVTRLVIKHGSLKQLGGKFLAQAKHPVEENRSVEECCVITRMCPERAKTDLWKSDLFEFKIEL